ncbi:hypothetical protein B005_0771 [Nocardiopsis alba ATCC BAA-2165]|uniref:Uncharacterized protein n=1 Tax=Nocardiopsis alba (strain ATCC BAA-2165 / BE74) TaxID=1205910 RepID=J7KYG2_NOCAA|nr:hypothetical protein B005_0771 [Nocardiopsis alba ATCC BAA-2165]
MRGHVGDANRRSGRSALSTLAKRGPALGHSGVVAGLRGRIVGARRHDGRPRPGKGPTG